MYFKKKHATSIKLLAQGILVCLMMQTNALIEFSYIIDSKIDRELAYMYYPEC